MTLASVIHGSMGGCSRVRRVVYPWLLGVEEDHTDLEMSGLLSWKDVSRAHRDMVGLKVGPTGQSHRFGIGGGRFGGAVEIRGVSGLGDALVGARRWDSEAVVQERDVVLGRDDVAAWEYVNRVRREMKRRWKESFVWMVDAEVAGFGVDSYFMSLEGLSAIVGLEIEGSKRELGRGMND